MLVARQIIGNARADVRIEGLGILGESLHRRHR